MKKRDVKLKYKCTFSLRNCVLQSKEVKAEEKLNFSLFLFTVLTEPSPKKTILIKQDILNCGQESNSCN
jgi:hypothetical protein